MSNLPKVEAILERQARFRELRKRVGAEGEGRLAKTVQGPWLTLSRQLGSGGTELARRLGYDLGWQVFDHEILRIIAENTHTREWVISQMDERAVGPLNDYLRCLLDSSLPGHQPIMREMMRVIWGLAQDGNAVIVGRGANWLLSPRAGVRLRTVAPRATRVQNLARDLGLDEATAEQRIDEDDLRRSEFVRQTYGQDIEDPLGYDMILNLDSQDLDAAEALVLTALRRRIGHLSLRSDLPD